MGSKFVWHDYYPKIIWCWNFTIFMCMMIILFFHSPCLCQRVDVEGELVTVLRFTTVELVGQLLFAALVINLTILLSGNAFSYKRGIIKLYLNKPLWCLQLLGDILLDRSNSAVMMRYVTSRDNLRILMNLLRVWCSSFSLDSYVNTSAPSPQPLFLSFGFLL